MKRRGISAERNPAGPPKQRKEATAKNRGGGALQANVILGIFSGILRREMSAHVG